MLSSYATLTLSFLLHTSDSVPCIPANTCFGIQGGNAWSRLDSSMMLTCNSDGSVVKQSYSQSSTCAGDPTSTATTEIYGGDDQPGSSTGSIHVDYLQGTNCPIDNPQEDCQEFMVLRHRGDRNHVNTTNPDRIQPRPYGDILVNCSNEASITVFSTVVVPVGCVNLFVGSNFFECDANGFSYTQYSGYDCTGEIRTAQSDAFNIGVCGYFAEWTHCNDPGVTSGCVGDGHLQDFHYMYELECCPNVQTCCGANSLTPLDTSVTNCEFDPVPTRAPTPPTPAPVTSAPVTSAPVTSAPVPTTAAPTGPSGTARPTSPTSPTSKPPTSAGTAEPTSPTTAAPTANGTARPTTPTTKPPTSPGTARPTTVEVTEGKEASAEEATMVEGVSDTLFWVLIVILILIICCCLCVCLYFFCFKKKRNTNQYFGNQDDNL